MATGTVLDGLRDWIDDATRALTQTTSDALRQRVELLDRLESLLHPAASAAPSLLRQATAARSKLEAANEATYGALRAAIRRGDGGPMLLQSLPRPRLAPGTNDHDGYDYLDEIVAGILQLDEPGPTTVEPTAEMVFYQPTPARHILDLLDRTSLTDRDVLIDLGSGLGHVALLTASCTPARSVGVEIEPAYVACARRAAARLDLKSATFIEADARVVPLDDATIFFLYTPFSGEILRSVLERLRGEAATRDIRVCAYGPCTETVASEDWLVPVEPVAAGRVAIFRSQRPTGFST